MKSEWANADSRLEFEEFDKDNIRVTAVYERDMYWTDEATVIIPKISLRIMLPFLKDITE
jgi:hypothetical protein